MMRGELGFVAGSPSTLARSESPSVLLYEATGGTNRGRPPSFFNGANAHVFPLQRPLRPELTLLSNRKADEVSTDLHEDGQVRITLGTSPDCELLKSLRGFDQSELAVDQVLCSSMNPAAMLLPEGNVGYARWHLEEFWHLAYGSRDAFARSG
jgi:hypothetical protein